jgi:hypothetical protein
LKGLALGFLASDVCARAGEGGANPRGELVAELRFNSGKRKEFEFHGPLNYFEEQ